MSLQFGANQIIAPDEIDAEAEIARGRDGALNGLRRRMIAAHRVNSDAHEVSVKRSRTCQGLSGLCDLCG